MHLYDLRKTYRALPFFKTMKVSQHIAVFPSRIRRLLAESDVQVDSEMYQNHACLGLLLDDLPCQKKPKCLIRGVYDKAEYSVSSSSLTSIVDTASVLFCGGRANR